MWKKLVSCLVVIIGVPVESAADEQRTRLEFYVGVYRPLEDSRALSSGDGLLLREKSERDIAVGSRLSVFVIGNLGFEGTFLFSPSSTSRSTGFEIQDETSNIWAVSGRLALYSSVNSTEWGLGLNAGVVFLGAGGDVARFRKRSGLGGVIGLTLLIPISRRNQLRLDAEEYFYDQSWQDIEDFPHVPTQLRDHVFSAGITFPLRF